MVQLVRFEAVCRFTTLHVTGGYTVGPQEIIDLLRQRSRPYLFSNTLPPPVVAAASKVLYNILYKFLFEV